MELLQVIILFSCHWLELPNACAAKSAYREAAETSQHSMLANTAGIICAQAMILLSLDTLPLQMRFDESKATHGVILTHSVFTDAVNMSPQSIQFSPYQLLTNVGDIACMYDNFKGDGSCNGTHN